MLQVFGYISGSLQIAYCIPYIRDILKGTTKPERASWFIWAVLGSIAFFSQWAKGATNSLWLPAAGTLGAIIISLLSIKFGVGGFTKRDKIALFVAGVGVLLWYLTKEAAIALLLVIAIDAVGVTLTLIKSYQDPASETFSTWFLSGLAGLFGMLAVGKLDYLLLAFPFFIFISNFAVAVALVAGANKKQIKIHYF